MAGLIYIAAWLSIGVGSLCAQDLMQRVLAANDEKVVVKAIYSSSAIYLIIGIIGPLLGIAYYVYYPDLSVVDTETIIPFIGAHMLSPVFSILFFVAIFGSTHEYLFCCCTCCIFTNWLQYF